MARLARLTLPGYVHHVIQRGNNRQPIFLAADDFQYFLDLLQDASRKFEVAVHAYVLMDNHFHLLVTPNMENGLPQMMQAAGREYVRYFNRKYQRTGTLWEGRYRSTVVQSERHLFACMVYLDLNPVRAGMVAEPSGYPWSSHGHYLGRRVDRLVTPHALYWSMGNTPFAREAAYNALVEAGLTADMQTQVTEAALQGWALGDTGFVNDLQKRTPRLVEKRSAGRPVSRIPVKQPA